MIAPLRATIMQARTIHLRRQTTPSNCRIDRLMRPAGSRLWVVDWRGDVIEARSEEHTSELQSLMRISYAVFCLKKKKKTKKPHSKSPATNTSQKVHQRQHRQSQLKK